MKTFILAAGLAILTLPAAGCSAAATNAVMKFNNSTCPVMGGKVNGKNHVIYDNVQYELCCKGCETTFLKEPAKYLANLPNNGKITAADNSTCPVMGGPVNSNIFTVYNGRKIYFCCPGCDKTFNADPAEYESKLKEVPVPEKQATKQ